MAQKLPNPPIWEMGQLGWSRVLINWIIRLADLNNSNPQDTANPFSNGSRSVETDSDGQLTESAITATELGYLNDATSNIQDQIDALVAAGVTYSSAWNGANIFKLGDYRFWVDADHWLRIKYGQDPDEDKDGMPVGGVWGDGQVSSSSSSQSSTSASSQSESSSSDSSSSSSDSSSSSSQSSSSSSNSSQSASSQSTSSQSASESSQSSSSSSSSASSDSTPSSAAGTNYNIVNVSTSTNVAGFSLVVLVDCSGGAITVTLDTDAVSSGNVIIVKDATGDAQTNTITIDTEGAETIDGAASKTIEGDYGALQFVSDGTNWFTIGGVPVGGVA